MKSVHPNIPLFRWFNFFTDFKLFAPLAVLYFSDITGSFALGMSIFSVAVISAAFLEIPTGVLSDRMGRKTTVTAGAITSLIACTLYAIGGSYGVLVMGAIAEGFSRAFYSGNNDALLHDSLEVSQDEATFGKHLGDISSYSQIALALSAVLGSLAAIHSFSLVMWLSVIPQIICVFLSFRMVDIASLNHDGNAYSHLKESFILFVKNPKLRLLSLSSILGYGISESTYQFQAAFYLQVWPVWAVGIAKVLSNIGAAIGFRYAGKLLDRFHPLQILFWGNLYRRGVVIASVISPNVFSPLLMATASAPWAFSDTAKSSLLQKEFSSRHRATMASLNSFGGNIMFGILAIAIGYTADLFAPNHALLFFQLVSFILLFMYWYMFRSEKRNKQI